MAAPTGAADTAAPPPPPPPPAEPGPTAVPDQKVSLPTSLPPQPDAPAPAPPTAPAAAPAPKKRKLDDVGFHTSDYYRIRAIVADLRVRFIQVYEATDFRNSDAAHEILKEMKVIMELSKKMRLSLGATSVPMKPFEKPSAAPVKDEHVKPSEKPSAVPVRDEPAKPSEKPSAEPVKVDAGPTPPVENNQAPQVVQAAVPPNSVSDDAPIKHDNSDRSSEGDKANPTQ